MTDRTSIDDIAREASAALGRAADRISDPPTLATLRARLDRRRRRRVGAAVAMAAVAGFAIVVSLVTGPGGEPVIVDRPTSGPSETEPSPEATEPAASTVTQDGWTLVDDPSTFGGDGPQVISSVAVAGDVTVAVGIDAIHADTAGGRTRPAVWRSVDGGPWQRDPGGSFQLGSRWDAAGVLAQDATSDGRAVLVAVGYANFEPREQPIAWVSTDAGEMWLEVEVGDEEDGRMSAVAWTGERFVAVGTKNGSPATWTSADGTTWLRHPPVRGEGSFTDIIVHDGRLVATSVIGDSSQLWVAETTGEPWWETAEAPIAGTISALHSDGGTLYAVGAVRPDGLDHDGVLLTSPDGVVWEIDQRSTSLTGPGDQLPGDILVDDGLLIITGQSEEFAAIWTATGSQPLQLLDRDLLPADTYVGTLLTGPDTILAFGTVAREAGVPDVVRWERGRTASATAGPDNTACPNADPPTFAGVPEGWEALPPPPYVRARAATVWTGDRLLFVGGDTKFGGQKHEDVAAYAPSTGAWTCHSPLATGGRRSSTFPGA